MLHDVVLCHLQQFFMKKKLFSSCIYEGVRRGYRDETIWYVEICSITTCSLVLFLSFYVADIVYGSAFAHLQDFISCNSFSQQDVHKCNVNTLFQQVLLAGHPANMLPASACVPNMVRLETHSRIGTGLASASKDCKLSCGVAHAV